jgi:hypothetical protein
LSGKNIVEVDETQILVVKMGHILSDVTCMGSRSKRQVGSGRGGVRDGWTTGW